MPSATAAEEGVVISTAKLLLDDRVNFSCGEAVPIPTLPLVSMMKLVAVEEPTAKATCPAVCCIERFA